MLREREREREKELFHEINQVWGADIRDSGHAWRFGIPCEDCSQVAPHNHPLRELTYANHPSNCHMKDVEVLDFVKELHAAGAKKTLIMEYLRNKTDRKSVV